MDNNKINEYVYAFRSAIDQYLRPGVSIKTVSYPFDSGAVNVINFNKVGEDETEVKPQSDSFADAFVMPSYSEGFPLAMLEAASMGKAIVCSDIPVFDEVFSDTEVSRFKNDDADSLKMAVERAILEKGILGENAKARFDKDYSAENFYNRHIEIYNDMIYSKRNNSNM